MRKVPLSKIKPQLLEKEGRLTEAFCAGVVSHPWGANGSLFEIVSEVVALETCLWGESLEKSE